MLEQKQLWSRYSAIYLCVLMNVIQTLTLKRCLCHAIMLRDLIRCSVMERRTGTRSCLSTLPCSLCCSDVLRPR